nr:hypothetical protein [Propionibacteriaceae bacterium]
VDPPYPPPSQNSAPPTQSSAPPTTGSPSDAVKAYLEALAAGQAATALALGDETPADKTFLTDAVLAESNRRAPITDINVPEVTDEYTYSVDASYKMGEEAVNDKFSVKKVGNGWKVRKSYAELNLAYARNKTLPMLVNKVAVKTDKIRVFPGAYAFTSGNKYVDYGSESVVLVQSPNDYPSMSEVKPTLTDAGLTAFEKSAQAELTACLKKKELAPAGCPFGLRPRSGQKVDESTIVWKLLEDPFANLKPRLDYQNPAIAEASVSMTVTFTAEGTSYGEKTRFGPQRVYSFAKVSADMTREPVKAILSR